MTETEKMRAILHELGVEYRDVNSMVTDVEHDGIKTRVYDYDDGPDYQLCVEQKWLTAEEAVRVALGIKSQEVLERRIDELREDLEFERSENGWVREFLNRMGQKCGTEDCPSLVAYVNNLESDNAKLREQIHWLKQGDILHVLTDQEYIDQCERERLMQVSIDAPDKENAKLRELARELWEGYNDPRCEECHLKDTPTCADCPICAREASVIDRMRELGVEVDG